jgi:hypothetical protein
MKNEQKIRFSEQAKSVFSFLENDGFKRVLESDTKVRFESSKVFVEICYGERDGEVFLSFGRIIKNEKFSFTLFLRKKNPSFEKDLGERLAYDMNEAQECLVKLAHALKTEGAPIISGEDLVFERMKSVRWWDFEPDALKKD